MFPWSPEFVPDAAHVLFLGAFYAVVCVVLGSVSFALYRALHDRTLERREAIAWHGDFEELPRSARRCRHEIAGELKERTCPNAFDCRGCDLHGKLVAPEKALAESGAESVQGVLIPADHLFHRGHAWARKEGDGTVTIGLDGLASRLLGTPDALELPEPGTRLVVSGTAFRVRKGEDEVRILSPADGTVVATGARESGWLLKLKPPEEGLDLRHLLSPGEARAFFLREIERLQRALPADEVGPALADGGTLADDLSRAIPASRRGRVYGEMFLEG